MKVDLNQAVEEVVDVKRNFLKEFLLKVVSNWSPLFVDYKNKQKNLTDTSQQTSQMVNE